LNKQSAIGCGALLIGWKNSGRLLHRDEQASKKKPEHLRSDIQIRIGQAMGIEDSDRHVFWAQGWFAWQPRV